MILDKKLPDDICWLIYKHLHSIRLVDVHRQIIVYSQLSEFIKMSPASMISRLNKTPETWELVQSYIDTSDTLVLKNPLDPSLDL